MDRYKISYSKNRMGHTISAKIIDQNTGQVVWTQNVGNYPKTQLSGKIRKQKVGDLKRAANAQLTQLQGQQTQELAGEDVSFDPETGFYKSEDGKSYATLEEAQNANLTLERKGEFDENLEEYEARITQAGREREELASRISARQQGQLMNQLQRAILGSGGDQAQIEALTPQVQEGGQRSLQDYISRSKAQTSADLAGATQLGIKGDFDLASLDQNQQSLTDAMTRFMTSEETDRAQFQATLDAQPEWWESVLMSAAEGAGSAATSYLLGV